MKTQIKENKGLFVLPLIVLPFVILIFYVLGGGAGSEDQEQAKDINGANYHLPDADRSIDILDKQEAYRHMKTQEISQVVKLDVDTAREGSLSQKIQDLPEENVNEALMAHVKRQERAARVALGQENEANTQANIEFHQRQEKRVTTTSNQSKRLTERNKKVSSRTKSKVQTPVDLDITELEGLFEEHEKLILHNDSLINQVYCLQQEVRKHQKTKQVFFEVSIHNNKGFDANIHQPSLIKAQIVEDSKVMTGNRIMMRLLHDIHINGETIKANILVYGLCKTDNERLKIQVSSIQGNGAYLPVNLSAYDLDGICGMYVPDNVVRKVYKDVAGGINPSVMLRPEGSSLTYMGVDAANDIAKTIFKRVRLKKVYLRKNTVLILKND